MKDLPSADIYEKEFKYWPWGKLVREVADTVIREAPQNSKTLDLMCGPGYLLNRIHQQRPDLELTGVDISEDFISYARSNYPDINFIQADVLQWIPQKKYDAIICTAGLHHLPYWRHAGFIVSSHELLNSEGFCIFGDPMFGDYEGEEERALAAAELGYESLRAVIKNKGDRDLVKTALDVMHNDVLMDGEFKTSVTTLRRLYEMIFPSVEMHKTWPLDGKQGYGDYYFILRNAK
ncbi:MAG: class I SAM-dependent methyltransferase [Nanoarchaeota archaeon]